MVVVSDIVRPPALVSMAPVTLPPDPMLPSTSCTIPEPSCSFAQPVKITFLVSDGKKVA